MRLRRTVVLAVCDGCGPDWWQLHEELDAPPLFVSVRAARSRLAGQFGWSITGRWRRTRMLCDHCAAVADCARYGHDFEELPATEWNGQLIEASRECARCGIRADLTLPPGHPESLEAELPADQEALLAALDAELFPGEAA